MRPLRSLRFHRGRSWSVHGKGRRTSLSLRRRCGSMSRTNSCAPQKGSVTILTHPTFSGQGSTIPMQRPR